MKTKHFYGLLAMALIFFFGLNACQKATDFSESDKLLAEEEAIAEAYFSEALSDADEAGLILQQNNYQGLHHGPGMPNGPGTTPGGPQVSGERIITVQRVDGESDYPGFPKLITIQFIDWQVGQGRIKNGTIYIYTTGPVRLPNTTRIITFENYTIDGNLIEGKKTISNIDGITFSITLEGGKITFTDGTFITREMEHTRQWIAGMETPFFIWDDEYLITGFCSGINRNGVEYNHTIVVPLHKKMDCRWFVSGTIEMQNGDNLVILDYGDGECDNIATITINGETTKITLPMRPRPRP